VLLVAVVAYVYFHRERAKEILLSFLRGELVTFFKLSLEVSECVRG
jgi:hypothetical protein